jgi:hypothetical protein
MHLDALVATLEGIPQEKFTAFEGKMHGQFASKSVAEG